MSSVYTPHLDVGFIQQEDKQNLGINKKIDPNNIVGWMLHLRWPEIFFGIYMDLPKFRGQVGDVGRNKTAKLDAWATKKSASISPFPHLRNSKTMSFLNFTSPLFSPASVLYPSPWWWWRWCQWCWSPSQTAGTVRQVVLRWWKESTATVPQLMLPHSLDQKKNIPPRMLPLLVTSQDFSVNFYR